MRSLGTFLVLSVTFLASTSHSQVPAFPGAQGFGSTTPGGRGGSVIFVTTLNPDGPGSFKEALQTRGPRLIIFRVGGTIDWTSVGGDVLVREPFVTIAGQTAPGDGIEIRNGMISISANDVIVRGLRFRVGDAPNGSPPGDRNGINVIGNLARNIIIDHCSISWAVDENVGVTGGAHDVTVQYCYVTEGLNCSIHPDGCHSKGLMANSSSAGNISFHHNVLVHNVDRNPQLVCPGNIESVNNIVMNFEWGGRFDNNAKVHFIGNRYIPGVNTKVGRMGLIVGQYPGSTRAFVQDNIGPGRESNTGDEWAITDAPRSYQSNGFLFPPKTIPDDVEAIWPSLLSEAGAIPHDAVDERARRDVLEGTGQWIDSQGQVGGWPVLRSGDVPRDGDNDGMPDIFEQINGLDPRNPNDANGDRDGDGYTNIEEYVNGVLGGDSPTTSSGKTDLFPDGFGLLQNFPNPFNPTTTIGYVLDEDAQVTVVIYDILGRVVTRLLSAPKNAGYNAVVWDGRDHAGALMNSGVYYYRIQAAGESGRVSVGQKKMILMK